MSGIIFFKTNKLDEIIQFYESRIDMKVWLTQNDCTILKNGNLLLGFCTRDEVEDGGTVTIFVETREEVDNYYQRLSDLEPTKPSINIDYAIYHFYLKDPEHRNIEFQCFLNDFDKVNHNRICEYLCGEELLIKRRSVRDYHKIDISDTQFRQIIESCRWAPTAKNSQSCYFVVIRDQVKIEELSNIRGSSSAPIGKGNVAIAICSDPAISARYVQDGCIAAYHFMLAAWQYGFGTCWIADMDRTSVKEILSIPHEHYVATVTPLGVPESIPLPRNRRSVNEMIKYL